MNTWPPQANYSCGNFSDTSCLKPQRSEGLWRPAFTVCIRTENQDQASSCSSAPWEVSVLPELALGHHLQSNSSVKLPTWHWPWRGTWCQKWACHCHTPPSPRPCTSLGQWKNDQNISLVACKAGAPHPTPSQTQGWWGAGGLPLILHLSFLFTVLD